MPETTNKSELANLLDDIRKNEEQMKSLVKELEGITPNRGKDTLDFCKGYTILVLKEYCHSLDDRELMLAACGLLCGDVFHEENMEDRVIAYWRYSHSYNKIFKRIKTEASATRKSRKEMKRIMDYLVDDLINDKNKNHGKLGLISKVSNKLELPEPGENRNNSSLSGNTSLPSDSQINEEVEEKFDDSVESETDLLKNTEQQEIEEETNPSTEKTRKGLTGSVFPIEEFEHGRQDTSVSNNNDDGNSKEKTPSSGIQPEEPEDFPEEQVHLTQAEKPVAASIGDSGGNDEKKDAKIAEQLSVLNRSLRIITGAFCVLVAIILISFIEEHLSAKNINTVVNNSVPMDAPATDDGLADAVPAGPEIFPEAESFSISEESKHIFLVPEQSEKIDIVLTPPDANISSLTFESSNPDIVMAEYGYVTAAQGILEGETYFVDITIEAKNYRDVIHVTVENPMVSDNAENLIGGGDCR